MTARRCAGVGGGRRHVIWGQQSGISYHSLAEDRRLRGLVMVIDVAGLINNSVTAEVYLH